jgi:hypothetical protein
MSNNKSTIPDLVMNHVPVKKGAVIKKPVAPPPPPPSKKLQSPRSQKNIRKPSEIDSLVSNMTPTKSSKPNHIPTSKSEKTRTNNTKKYSTYNHNNTHNSTNSSNKIPENTMKSLETALFNKLKYEFINSLKQNAEQSIRKVLNSDDRSKQNSRSSKTNKRTDKFINIELELTDDERKPRVYNDNTSIKGCQKSKTKVKTSRRTKKKTCDKSNRKRSKKYSKKTSRQTNKKTSKKSYNTSKKTVKKNVPSYLKHDLENLLNDTNIKIKI